MTRSSRRAPLWAKLLLPVTAVLLYVVVRDALWPAPPLPCMDVAAASGGAAAAAGTPGSPDAAIDRTNDAASPEEEARPAARGQALETRGAANDVTLAGAAEERGKRPTAVATSRAGAEPEAPPAERRSTKRQPVHRARSARSAGQTSGESSTNAGASDDVSVRWNRANP